jgi:hypothetical protein
VQILKELHKLLELKTEIEEIQQLQKEEQQEVLEMGLQELGKY